MRVFLISCLLATLALAAPMASAQQSSVPVDQTDVLGNWTFQTKAYRGGQCLMTGSMRLSSHPEEGLYNCEITAVEVCSLWGRSVVLQSCAARRFGNQVSVRSSIDEMLEKDFEGLIYVPDNFTLTIQSSERMFGALVSAVTAPVEFRRSVEGIS